MSVRFSEHAQKLGGRSSFHGPPRFLNMEGDWFLKQVLYAILCYGDFVHLFKLGKCSCIYIGRSSCSLVCKWTYLLGSDNTDENGWQRDFFEKIGLSDLIETNFEQLGAEILFRFVL